MIAEMEISQQSWNCQHLVIVEGGEKGEGGGHGVAEEEEVEEKEASDERDRTEEGWGEGSQITQIIFHFHRNDSRLDSRAIT